MEQYRKIKFYINTNEHEDYINTYHKIFVICDGNELYCKNGGGNFSLYLNDSLISLDFNTDTRIIENFGGIVVLNKQKSETIDLPTNVTNGIMCVDDNHEFLSGSGWRIDFNYNIIYDKNNSRIILGNYDKFEQTYKILGNVLVQLYSDNSLKSILITNL